MNTILDLREKRAKVWDNAKDFLDSNRGKDGLISEDDSAIYDKMEQEVVNLGKEIDRLEKQSAMDLELNKTIGSPILEKPSSAPNGKIDTGKSSAEYKEAFWKIMRNTATTDVLNSLHVGTDGKGGYLVPDEFEKQLIQTLEEENIFRKLATIIHTSNGDRKIPVVASKGTASWVEE